MKLFGIVLFSIFGVFMLTTQSFANSLDTSSDVNKIGALQIFDLSGSTLLGLNLGVSDSISSVTLTFDSNIPASTTVNISLKDPDDIEIGSGSTVTGGATNVVIINLSNTITDAERSILQSTRITVT